MIGSRYPEWPQGADLNVLIDFFRRTGLKANIEKSKAIICQPRAIRSGMSAEAFTRRSTGEGANYRDRLRRRIPCPECGVEMTAGSLTAHLI